MNYWVKIILILIIMVVFITICALIGIVLDGKDKLKKQLKILSKKGYNIDTDFIGKGLCKFNIYLDNVNNKVILFNGHAKVFNYVDLKNYVNKVDNINDKICYVITFQLGTDFYKVVMKNNSKQKVKDKFDELGKILEYVIDNNEKKTTKKTSTKKNVVSKKTSTKKASTKKTTTKKTK